MDSEEFLKLMMTICILGGIVFIAMLVTGVAKGKEAADKMVRDANKAERKIVGKVIEKTTESHRENAGLVIEYTIDWILFEQEDGIRVRLRNIPSTGILLATGDEGTLTVRGETIYGFTKK